jgi:hypothetical protein
MNIVVVGSGPWPLEKDVVVTGPSIRLRQFVEPLVKACHDVTVVLLEDHGQRVVPIDGVVQAKAFPPEEISSPDLLKNHFDFHSVNAVFGVGSLLPAAAAARLAKHLNVPCWIDFFGDPIAELHAAQLRQGGAPDVMARDHIWKLTREALMQGDMFSTVSNPQRHAMMGQLGLLGRYENHWDICQRIEELPCAVPESWTEFVPLPSFPKELSDAGLNVSSRYVFFGGSWNVWLDEKAMARSLRKALDQDPQLYLVTYGIPTGPLGECIHQSLMSELDLHKERIIDLGGAQGVCEAELLAYAGACVSLDRSIPEAELGSRNRLLTMVRWGARPVVTLEAGIEGLLVAIGLAAGIDSGDDRRAAREILKACSRTKEEREKDRRAGVEWLRSVTFEETLKPALHWLAQGAPRWERAGEESLVDGWAKFPAEPEKLFGKEQKKNWPFFR